MLASAIAEPRRIHAVRNTFVDMGHDWPTCYSVQEALRTVRFYRGEIEIPEELRHFCALPSKFDPVTQGGKRFEDADFVLLEPNTNLYHMFSGIPITRTEIDRYVLFPLRTLNEEISNAAIAWFTYGLLDCNENIQKEAAATLIPALEGRVENPRLAREILLGTRSVASDREAYFAAIAELKELISKPLGLVTFTFKYMPSGRGLSWPPDFVENTLEASRQLGIPCFHPAALVRKYGAKVALKEDLQFYRPEFEPVIGDDMMKFCLALAGSGLSEKGLERDAQAADAPAPSQSVAESYSTKSFEANPPLAYVDVTNAPADWNVVRASLSIDSVPTPIEGIQGRKLIEAVTPDATTHDIRGHVANPGGARRFRLSLLVCSDEREQIRLWLGTAPGGGERTDVSFDLKTGQPLAYTATKTWRVRDAGTEAIGKSWCICWIVAEVKESLSTLFVLVTTAVARGMPTVGDGKSGLWIGGVRVDALSDTDSDTSVTVRLDDNRKDLADLVSAEILTFLREEFDACGDIYHWYRTRYLANNVGLSKIELAIANFVISRYAATRKVLEIGAGIAQCSQFLALSGVQTIGIEANTAHFEMMRRLVDRLSARFDPELTKRFTPLQAFYPDDVSSHIDEKTVVIVPSLSSTLTPEQEIRIFDALRPADGIILGTRLFFRSRETEDERRVLIEEIQKRGFGEPEMILRWNDWNFGFAPDRIIYLPKV